MKTALYLCTLCLLLFHQVPAYAKKIKMAVFKLEPFMMVDEKTGKLCGVTVDYWKEFLAPEMGIELEVLGLYPILRATHLLKNGEVDVVSQLTRIPEREALFLYPETSLTTIKSCLIVLPDSPLQEVIASEDIFGMTIGFIKAGYIPDMLIHPKITMDLITTTDFRELNYQKLMRKRMDAVLDINVVSQMYWFKKKGYLDNVRIIMLPVEPVPVYSIFRNNNDGRALRETFDKANRKGLDLKKFETLSKTYLNP